MSILSELKDAFAAISKPKRTGAAKVKVLNPKARQRIYRKLCQLLKRGKMTNTAIAGILESLPKKHPDRPALEAWRRRVESGAKMHEAMRGWLPDDEMMMIAAGEESAHLPEALDRASRLNETSQRMSRAIRGAFGYPAMIIIVISGIMYQFAYTVIPTMVDALKSSGIEPDGTLTLLSITICDIVRDWGVFILPFPIAIAAAIGATMPTLRGDIRRKLDKYPPWSVYRLQKGTAFLLSLADLVNCGKPHLEALQLLRKGSNPYVAERLDAAIASIASGRQLHEAFRAYEWPDLEIVVDLAIYAQDSDLSTALSWLADDWLAEGERRINTAADAIRNIFLAIGAVTLAVLAAGVGSMVIMMMNANHGM